MMYNLKTFLWAATLLTFSLGTISDGISQCDPSQSPYSIFLADESDTQFPTDISWSITSDSTGEVILSQDCPAYEGGNYNFCLTPGEDYTFTALDDFGDGWDFPDGSIAWAILYGNGQIAFSGENPTNGTSGDSTEDCIGFDEEFSFTFTAEPPLDCNGAAISIETKRYCSEGNFDATVTIEALSDIPNFPLVLIFATANGQQLGGGTALHLVGEMLTLNNLPLDTDIIISVEILGAFCPSTELINVSSDSCVTSLTCGEGLQETYCYENSDESEFAYQSPNDEPITLVFTEGLIEQCCDNIAIYDGLDTTGEVLFEGNNDGNLANVSVTANSGTIFMKLDTGFLGSCETGDPDAGAWTWVVGCGAFDIPGCTDPTAFNFNPDATSDNGTCEPFAINDQACGAILLECNTPPLTGNFDNSSSGPELDDCVSPFVPSDGDIWFKFESDGNSVYTISEESNLNHAVGVYSGDDCENLTEAAICPQSNSFLSAVFPAGTYYFLLRPFGGGSFSNFYEVSLTCIPNCSNPFPAVEEASLSNSFQGNGYQLEWDALENQTGCQVAVRFANGNTLGQQIVMGQTVNSFFLLGEFLETNTEYEWRVRCGCSQSPRVVGPWSSWQPFTTPGGSSITSSPNPTSGQSFVSFTALEKGYTTLEVYDTSGRLVQSIFAGAVQPDAEYRFEFDGSALPNGVYLYRLTTGAEVVTEKFMIMK